MKTFLMKITPTPGSSEAGLQGCICPVQDNDYGRGIICVGSISPQFWITEGCLLHDKRAGDDGHPSDRRAAWLKPEPQSNPRLVITDGKGRCLYGHRFLAKLDKAEKEFGPGTRGVLALFGNIGRSKIPAEVFVIYVALKFSGCQEAQELMAAAEGPARDDLLKALSEKIELTREDLEEMEKLAEIEELLEELWGSR